MFAPGWTLQRPRYGSTSLKLAKVGYNLTDLFTLFYIMCES